MDNLDLFFYFPGASSAILLCMVTEPKYLKSAIDTLVLSARQLESVYTSCRVLKED